MNIQNTKKHKLGSLGESLVAKVFNLTKSIDPFDVDYDLKDENGSTYEVKTQVRHPFKGCFTINTAYMTNMQKCINVDHLIFVEYNNDDVIRIWECTNREFDEVFTTRDGRNMAGWKINKMKLLKEIEDPAIASEMKSYSSSSFISN
jgi:hypothetical protein